MDRSHLLQGLRTGGPRSASFGNPPLTANPGQTRFASNTFQSGFMDEPAQLVDRFGNISLNGAGSAPMTANPELVAAALQQQQQQQIALLQAQAQVAAMIAQQNGGPVAAAEAQAMQMQIQMELMRIQAHQQQQDFRNQILLQQQQMQQQQLRQAPSTAGPFQSSFPDAAAAQTRTAAAAALRARAVGREATLRASASDEQIAPPMTAGVNGKFGVGMAPPNRAVSSPLNPNAAAFVGRFNPDLSAAIAAASSRPSVSEAGTPPTPTYGATTVISGGTSLGSPGGNLTPSNSYNGLSGYNNNGAATGPTKSDSASSWRRGSTSSTPIQATPTNGFPKAPSPPARQRSSSPPGSGSSTPPNLSLSTSTVSLNSDFGGRNSAISPLKTRPSPLRFTSPPPADGITAFGNATSMGIRSGSPSYSNDGISLNDDAASSIKSSPTSSTPPSSAGSAVAVSASALTKEREEAAKKLYEGLGMGRPAPYPANNVVPSASIPNQKVEPIRQPMGPPCSVDELGPINFASRMRKRALGGLMDARERREAAAALNVEMVGA